MTRTKGDLSEIIPKGCNGYPFDYNKHIFMKNLVGEALYYYVDKEIIFGEEAIVAFNVERCQNCMALGVSEEYIATTPSIINMHHAICTLKRMGLKQVPPFEFEVLPRIETLDGVEYYCEECMQKMFEEEFGHEI